MSTGFEGPLVATLAGGLVTLEPLAEEHRDGLWEAAQAEQIWAWLSTLNQSREYFDGWLDTGAGERRGGGVGAQGDRHLRRAPPRTPTGSWSGRVAT